MSLLHDLAGMPRWADSPPKPQTAARTTTRAGGRFDLQDFIARHGLEIIRVKPWQVDGQIHMLAVCPFNADHGQDSGIIEHGSGALSFKCFHNGCQGNDWHALRDLKEPGWRDRKAADDFNGSRDDEATNTIQTMTVTDILATEFPEPVWVVPQLIPSGLTIFAGAPKLGKSWLSLGIGLALAYGGRALGKIPVEQTEVLYLTLEDTARRIQGRLESLFAEPTEKLHFHFSWRRGQEAVDDLDVWLWQHKAVKVVIIDTLQKIRAPARGRQQVYEADYEAVSMIKQLADRHDIAVVIVHHTRKARGDDEIDLISGSYGISGAADTAVILKRARNEADGKIFIVGRDVEEQVLALKVEHGVGWTLLGDARQYEQTKERLDILRVLEEAGEPMTPKEIGGILGKKAESVRFLLRMLEKEGFVSKVGHGKYIAITTSDASDAPNTPHAPFTPNAEKRSADAEKRSADTQSGVPGECTTPNFTNPESQQVQGFEDTEKAKRSERSGVSSKAKSRSKKRSADTQSGVQSGVPRECTTPNFTTGWDQAEADRLVVRAAEQQDEVLSANALRWAKTKAPEYIKKLTGAENQMTGAWQRRDMGLLRSTAEEVGHAARALADAYRTHREDGEV